MAFRLVTFTSSYISRPGSCATYWPNHTGLVRTRLSHQWPTFFVAPVGNQDTLNSAQNNVQRPAQAAQHPPADVQHRNHATPEYDTLPSTRIGRTVFYFPLSAFPRGTRLIAYIVLWPSFTTRGPLILPLVCHAKPYLTSWLDPISVLLPSPMEAIQDPGSWRGVGIVRGKTGRAHRPQMKGLAPTERGFGALPKARNSPADETPHLHAIPPHPTTKLPLHQPPQTSRYISFRPVPIRLLCSTRTNHKQAMLLPWCSEKMTLMGGAVGLGTRPGTSSI